ncbi:hypothetical protein NC3_01880 [Bacillus altitudinis]|nr:hypothetical protein NC3_01880 [Bacillus altitudinis]
MIRYEKRFNEIKNFAIEESKCNEYEIIEIQRKNWLKLKVENPELSKTQLRKMSPATYIYLYRNDNEWLQDNSPNLEKRRCDYKGVDWEKRDLEILSSIRASLDEISHFKGKPKRVTIKRIGDVVGVRALLEQHLEKMDKTKAYIASICESKEDFRLRRVQKVIEENIENGENIVRWKVLRRAGIKKKFYKDVENHFK